MKTTKSIITVGAIALTLLGAISTTADAKTKLQKRVYNVEMSTAANTRNFTITGKNALYSYPKTVNAKAKTVASTKTMAKVAKAGTYFRAYRELVTSKGYVYYKVVSFDAKYRGYIYAGKVDKTITKGTGVADLKGGVRQATTTTDAALPAKTTVYFNTAKKNGIWNAPAGTQYGAKKIVSNVKPFADDALTVTKAAKNAKGTLYYYVTSTDPKFQEGWIYSGALKETAPVHNAVSVQFKLYGEGTVVGNGVLQNKDEKNPVKAGDVVKAADIKSDYVAAPAGYTLDDAHNATQTPTAKYDSADVLTVFVTANTPVNQLADFTKARDTTDTGIAHSFSEFVSKAVKADGSAANIMANIAKDPFFTQPKGKLYTASEMFSHLQAAGATDFYTLNDAKTAAVRHVLTQNGVQGGTFGTSAFYQYAATDAKVTTTGSTTTTITNN